MIIWTKKLLDWQNIRTNHLKNIRNNIQIKSNIDKKKRIRIHIIDTAIKIACASYKSCITNYINENIKKFRIKFWKTDRTNKFIEIEKEFIKDGKILYDVFKDFKFTYNNEPHLLQKDTVKILYRSDIKKYYLLVSEKIEPTVSKKTKFIGIDQGIKPFIACRTNDELLQIGTEVSVKIDNYLTKIETLKNKRARTIKMKKNIKKKIIKLNLDIRWLIDELHWKTIKFITNNYKYVVIGNVNMLNIIKEGKSNLNARTASIGLRMRMGEFRRRLEYKCLINGINYFMVNEAYTSKVCSKCGNCKKELKGEKIYNCTICNVKRDRDLNSATNMLLLTL